MVWFSGSYEEEGPPIAVGEVRKAFRRKWKYKFTTEEYGERQFSIIIRGRNVAVEKGDLKDLFVRDLMIDKVHVKELKL